MSQVLLYAPPTFSGIISNTPSGTTYNVVPKTVFAVDDRDVALLFSYGFISAPPPVNSGGGVVYPRVVDGTTDTLLVADNGNGVQYTNSGAVTVTVPAGLEAFQCFLIQAGAGAVTPTTDETTVITNRQSQTATAGQWAVVSLTSISADNFVLAGDTA